MGVALTEEELRQVQRIELEMLCEVDRICRKRHIHYSIASGTLLGAVRHRGFIPWDDDADVAMTREEYRRFVVACQTDLDTSRFCFQDMDTTPGYRWGYGKIRRKNSLYVREHQENMPYEQGIFIDVFPRDGVPDGLLAERLFTFAAFCLRKSMWSAVGRYTSPQRWQRVLYTFLYLVSKPWLKCAYHGMVAIANRRPRKRVRVLTSPMYSGGKGYPAKWYRHYGNMDFEGCRLMVQSHYKEWLALEYRDYMTLPPLAQRQTHPVSIFRLPKEQSL